jgi:transposase
MTLEEKDALILALLKRIEDLEARLGQPPKTPDNSSVPPSRGAKRNRPPRQKKPRQKREGPGTTRRLAETPDRVVDCPAEACAHCGTAIPAAEQSVRHAYDHIDLPPIRPIVTRVRLFGRRCPCCRRRARGTPPETMPPGSPFGDTILAMLGYLHHHHAIAYERLARLMGELFGLSISEGAIANALKRLGERLAPATEAIRETTRTAEVVGCDETGARLTTDQTGTRMAWEWVAVTRGAVYHHIAPSRGAAVVREIMGDHRPRCWVSDRWSAQLGHAETHQVCLAHVLRDVQYAIDAGEPAFAPAVRRLLRWTVAIGRRRDRLKDTTLQSYHAKAERRLDAALSLPVTTEAGRKLLAQVKRWRAHFFSFLRHRDVPPTNNEAERALRPSVTFRKVTNGFRSAWGALTHARTRSVIGTGRLNDISAHQAISQTLAGQYLVTA